MVGANKFVHVLAHMQCACHSCNIYSAIYMPGTWPLNSFINMMPTHQEMPLSQHCVNLPDGGVNIMLIHIFPEVHPCRGFRHAEHALKVPHSHRHAMTDGCFFAQGGVHLRAPCSAADSHS